MPSGIGQKNKKREGVTQETKREVAERDNYSCVICGNSDIIDEHHCFKKSEYFGEDKNEAFNLVCLCRDCHNKAHGGEEEIDKQVKQMALWRYSGENRKRLLEIYQNKFGEVIKDFN